MTLDTLEVVAHSMGITSINIHKAERIWLCVTTGEGLLGTGRADTILEALNAAIVSYKRQCVLHLSRGEGEAVDD